MTPEQIDHVFGRGRLKMVTGPHVEVFREAAAPGESRRYTKRFLTTADGDYAEWTEREWRILALLIGHGSRCVPDVVQYDRGARGTKLVQTYDAGATVDQWATLLPVERDARVYARVFEDCAHWWGLAHHCLVALDEIHALGLVHLDVKGDNICIPIGPDEFDPAAPQQRLFPVFGKLTLIDFAFSLVSGESLSTPLPIGWQQDYDYQSPRLLHALEAGRAGDLLPTETLDWRCDMYSLAAMLKRYLPREQRLYQPELADGWTPERYDAAKSLILRIREVHDRDLPSCRPHFELITQTSAHVREDELAQSLERGWVLARDAQSEAVPALPLTPVTRLARPIRIVIPPRDEPIALRPSLRAGDERGVFERAAKPRNRMKFLAVATGIAAIGIAPLFADTRGLLADAAQRVGDGSRVLRSAWQSVLGPEVASGEALSTRPGAEEARAAGLPGTPMARAAGAGGPTNVSDPAAEAGHVSAALGGLSEASVTTAEPSAPPAEDAPESQLPQPETSEQAPPSSTSPAAMPSPPPTEPSAAPTARLKGDSRTARREASRSAPAPRSSSGTRTPSSTPPSAARALPSRPAGTRQGTQLAETSKFPRSANSARAVVPQTPPSLASKRSNSTSIAAARTPQSLASRPSGSTAVAAARTPKRGSPSLVASAAMASGPGDRSGGSGAAAVTTAPALPAPSIAAVSAAGAGALASDMTPALPAPNVAAVMPPSQAAPDLRAGIAPPAPAGATTPRGVPSGDAPRAWTTPSTAVVSASPPAASTVDAPRLPAAPMTQAASQPAAPIIQAPRPAAPPAADAYKARPSPTGSRGDDAYLAQAHRALAEFVPRTSAQSRAQITRALWVAGSAYHPAQERAVIAAAASPGGAGDLAFAATYLAPVDARRLHEEARQAYFSRRQLQDALDLELKAFGANPNDPEIAGQLAVLYLKAQPVQPERARQLALHAIGMRNARFQSGYPEDWTTFAIASALTGHETDAKHGLFASLALAGSVDRVCRTAQGALATYGERLREPVEALLYRVHAQGRADDSPYCAWPRNRIVSSY